MSFYEKLVIAPIKFVFDLDPVAFIISIIIFTAISVYFLTIKYACTCPSNRREFAVINKEILPEEQKKLLSKLEFLENKIVRLADKISSLNITANISKEQLDFATTNLNGIAIT
jgi:hypothetical protein